MIKRGNEVCRVLQEIGLPAVRLAPISAEVVEANELFSSLANPEALLESRVSFLKGVLPRLGATDRTSWEASFANQRSAEVRVGFKSLDGRALDFEMRSFAVQGQKRLAHSVLCVFIPLTTQAFKRVCDEHLSEGRELERSRMRHELHRGVSQQLLGAAFGCKVLSGKVATLSGELGKEASDLAQLVNDAVTELQSLVQSDQIQPGRRT